MEKVNETYILPLPNHSRIFTHLYQGARPPTGPTLLANGFDVVVLCAEEYQRPPAAFMGIRVLSCPYGDSFHTPLTFDERRMIADTAARVAQATRGGARVYVSCAQGINRSGLVSALAVRQLTGCSGLEARRWVQKRRQGSLTNPIFAGLLDALPEKPSARAAGSPLA
jgi:protein-tyrosine phosphatase